MSPPYIQRWHILKTRLPTARTYYLHTDNKFNTNPTLQTLGLVCCLLLRSWSHWSHHTARAIIPFHPGAWAHGSFTLPFGARTDAIFRTKFNLEPSHPVPLRDWLFRHLWGSSEAIKEKSWSGRNRLTVCTSLNLCWCWRKENNKICYCQATQHLSCVSHLINRVFCHYIKMFTWKFSIVMVFVWG